MTADRACRWCRGPIPEAARVDAITCSKRCRQARNRFIRAVGSARGAAGAAGVLEPMRFAYADPPYPGKSRRYYGEHRDYAGEVDHVELVARLSEYDGWALSTSASALQHVLSLCPQGSRVAAWHRGERPNRRQVIVNAWEPVIYFGARPVVLDVGDDTSRGSSDDTSSTATVRHDVSRRPGENVAAIAFDGSGVAAALRDVSRGAGATRRVDSLVLGVSARTTDPERVTGAKPAGFARWVFELLGATHGDELDDLFPGSGAIARAWDIYTGRAA